MTNEELDDAEARATAKYAIARAINTLIAEKAGELWPRSSDEDEREAFREEVLELLTEVA